MSHFYRLDNVYEPAPHVRSPKKNPFQMSAYTSHTSRVSPGKPRTDQFLDQTQHDSDQSLLEMLNSTVACLKQKNMDLEALGCLEQSLWLKRRMFGVDNSVVHKALNEVMLSYNSVAMQYLAQGQFDQCLAMLRKAEAITAPGNFKRCQALQILTFNNIGCCYRKLGKLKSALKYLKEAAQVGSGSTHVKNLSITHLNLCAIQSQLGRHDLALEHAQAAIFHTQEELVSLEDGNADDRNEDDPERDQAALVDALDAKTREEKIIALAVAYHNLAVELEFNGRGEASLQWYKKALQLVWKYRETNEALCVSFKKIFLDAKKKQKTANVRQNGIPTAVNTSNNAGVRRPAARPKSAHASSRYTQESDVSYSSTVASQCYKATKPSTAGQRYDSPRNATVGRTGKTQRPASATARQRPQSAKPSMRSSNNEATRSSRDSEDLLEEHWKKLEREYSLNDSQTPQSKAAKTERKSRRPQSAGGATSGARRQRQTTLETKRREQVQGQICFAGRDDDIIGNDDDYGVILDEGDSDDGFDDYMDALPRNRGSSQRDRLMDNRAPARVSKGSIDSRNQRPSAAGMQRHRRVLNDSRLREQNEVSGDSDAESSRGPEVNSPSMSLTGYNGDDDGDTDSEVPTQRVGHMEYLRRMKKLAECIKDDLNGVEVRSPTTKQPHLRTANTESSPKISTPRSAMSKVRDRLEQARRESLENLHEPESYDPTNDDVQATMYSSKDRQSKSEDDGVIIQEDNYVFGSEADARDAERQLFRAAAGRRLQSFFRGQHCRSEVSQLKKVKLENNSAAVIQRQIRQYLLTLEERRRQEEEEQQLELQKAEVEDMAACLIQRLYHRSMRKQKEEVAKATPPPQRLVFSIADVVLGATMSSQASLHPAGKPDPPQLNATATVPRLNLSQLSDQGRHPTLSSIPLETAKSSIRTSAQPSPQSNRDEEVTPKTTDRVSRTARRSAEEQQTKSTDATPRTTGSSTQEVYTPLSEVTPRTSRSSVAAVSPRQQNEAAIRIQALVRGDAVRRRAANEEAGYLTRMYIERKHFNVALDQALELEQVFLEELSAIKIQALVRGQQSRLLTECFKAGINTAAITIQRSFRIHRQFTHRSIDEGVRIIAARTIQQVYRDFEARRSAIHQAAVDKEVTMVQEIAATTIQSFWRQITAVHDHCLEEIEAATCIQALSRGHLIRKSMRSLNGSSSGSGLSKHSSAFSMSSSAEKIATEEGAAAKALKETSLSINYSFLPASIRELYLESSQGQVQRTNDQVNAREIAELGLTFGDFLREFESCSDAVVAASALDAMRVLVETSPETSKTLANVVRIAQVLDHRLREGFWNPAIESASFALLQAFEDVLDTQ